MVNFLNEQIDYIFLCYIVSFFMLATVCFSIEITQKYRAVFKWVGLFAVMEGAYGFLMMVSGFLSNSFILRFLLVVTVFLAYLFLLESVRCARDIIGKKSTGFYVWFYAAVLLLIVLASEYGLEGIEGVLRYCFGVPVGLASVGMWFSFGEREQSQSKKRQCLLAALATAGYALLTAFNGPAVVFSPTKLLDTFAFLKIIENSAQFSIALLIFILTLILLLYFGHEKKRKVFMQLVSSKVLLSSWLILALVGILAFGGWFTNYLGRYAFTWLSAHHHVDAADLLYNLTASFTKTDQAVRTISGSPWIAPALVLRSAEDIERANSVLERYTSSLLMLESFLVDTNGVCVASSTRPGKAGAIGASFASKPYFKEALKGALGYAVVNDGVLNKPSYYAAFPIKGESQEFLGAVVMGTRVDNIDVLFEDVPYVFFIDQEGRIFLSNQPRFISQGLWPVVDPSEGGQPRGKKPLLAREVSDGEKIVFQGEEYFLIRKLDEVRGWSIVLLASVKPIIAYRTFALMLVLSLCVLVMVFFAAVRQRENMVTLIATVNTQLKNVLSAATHISIIATETQGLITVFNTGAEKMLGFKADEMIEMHTPEVIHIEPELDARARELDVEFGTMLNGFDVLVEYAKRGKYDEREWTYKRADGTYITVNLSITAQRNGKQEITGYLFVASDITERKWAENRLQEQTEFTENLVQHSGIATFVLDAQHKVIFWNKACEELTGMKASEMTGKDEPWRAFYAQRRPVLADIIIENKPEEAVNFYALCGKSTLAPKGLKAEGWYKNLGGIDRYIIFEAAPIYNAKGELIAAIETLQDITDRKRAEESLALKTKELERSNTELERFAYVASHDLQEPLRMVNSYIQLIEKRYKDKLDKDAFDFINFAVDGVNWMQSLINALLTYSRVGTRAKEFQAADCNQVLARVLMNLQVAIDEHKAVITHEQLPVIIADMQQLEQLFQNLIGNAIKFQGDEPPRVHITAEQAPHEWIFSVHDNGIGIEPQYADRIFEIFQRLHSRKEYPGTGIGLAVCKKIVERHGGHIWVESFPGKGATFYFNIPIRR